MPSVDPKIIIRMGTHAEKSYLIKTMPYMDGIILGANLVEATPGATASLLVTFGGKKLSCSFFIDPMTYAFGSYIDSVTGKLRTDLDWIMSDQKIKGKTVRAFKRSYRKLAEEFGDPFESALTQKTALGTGDFTDASIVETMCRSVIDYQKRRIATEFGKDPEFKEYTDTVPTPTAFFAPYFYIEPSNWKPWADINILCATTAAKLNKSDPTHAILCVDEAFLGNQDFLDLVIEELPKTGVKAVWLWFSKLREEASTESKLSSLRSLVENLSESMEVYNLHGGYFSLALCKHGLSGISHGVGYGEQKDVVPVIGKSTPTVRYYLPDVHRRLGVPQIERCFKSLGISTSADFSQNVCDCVVCKGVLTKGLKDFSQFGDSHFSTSKSRRLAQTPAAAKRCRFHFLLRRIKERDDLKSQSLQDVVDALNTASVKWAPQPTITNEVTHLPVWEKVLK